MFAVLKEQLDIVEVAETLLGIPFKSIGDTTWAPEDETCPFCGHKDCFRIKKDGADSFYKCFSCDENGDAVSMVASLKELSNVDAARLLAKEFNIQLPRDYSPVQEVMNLAANYYHQCLIDGGPAAELGGLTPVEYQVERRGHTVDSLTKFQIGWSDGKVVQYLESLGVAAEIIAESGLVNKKLQDFFPTRSFIYPHKVRGRTSHFTFKDPLKQKEYQLPSKHKLNGHSFYNSDSINKSGAIIVVEGENDAISVCESGWESGVICCNGSISQSQLEWLSLNLKDRDIISIFDSDPAGDKYREKVGKLQRDFKSLIQVKLGNGVKDIDEYLKSGGDLKAVIQQSIGNENSEILIDGEESSATPIIEKNGCYYRIRFKDGNEHQIQLTNFTIRLRNIFIRGNEREREIVMRRNDGKESAPVMIPSEAKVSLKPFKTLAANAIDASFYGKEDDLIAIWEHVYRTSKEVVVHLPECVGRVEEFKGWLFGDSFISDTGAVYQPDENGVIWIQNKSVGLRAMSMETQGPSNGELSGVPKLTTDLNADQRSELIGGVLANLSRNLGQPGIAVTTMAWAWACVYSNDIFNAFKFFPFIYLWGKGGRGKTTINKWILSFYDLESPGWNPANQLNSGVSFSRKLSYYASLPMCVDELKLERPIIEMYGTFRSWYNRGGRTVSSKENFGVRTQEVRATVMFAGEDQFLDPSTRQRCLHMRIPRQGREEIVTYKWIDDRSRDLPAIGYHWITSSSETDRKELITEIKSLDTLLRNNGISSRTSLNWAIVAYFGNKLCSQYMPEFNYMEYLYSAAREDIEKQKEDDTITEFWGYVEGIQSEERSRITGDHIRRVGNELYVWFPEIFRIVQKEESRLKDTFSKRAIMEALREEDYFLREDRIRMGIKEDLRRGIVLDLTKAPEIIQQIAGALS